MADPSLDAHHFLRHALQLSLDRHYHSLEDSSIDLTLEDELATCLQDQEPNHVKGMLMTDNLGDIFTQARGYGLVDLCTLDGGTYSCSILIEHEQREMKAKSGYGHRTPASAITAAMEAAEGMSNVRNPPSQSRFAA